MTAFTACIFQLFTDVDSASMADTIDFSGWNHALQTVPETEENGVLGWIIIIIVAFLVWCFMFLNWISSRYWDRGIFPPFLRFSKNNHYEAIVNLAVNIMRCDRDNIREKYVKISRFVARKFPHIGGDIKDSYRSAESQPVSTESISTWLGKRIASKSEKIALLEFLFDLAVTDGALGRKEHGILLVFTQQIGLDPGLLQHMAEVHNRSRAERLYDEQEQHRPRHNVQTGYNREKAMQILGLAAGFTPDDLKKAYRSLAKQYHPDLYIRLPEEEMQRMAERFVEVQEAYEYLTETQ